MPVAVKTLSSRNFDDLKKFKEEAQLTATFCHSNIVSLLGMSHIVVMYYYYSTTSTKQTMQVSCRFNVVVCRSQFNWAS